MRYRRPHKTVLDVTRNCHGLSSDRPCRRNERVPRTRLGERSRSQRSANNRTRSVPPLITAFPDRAVDVETRLPGGETGQRGRDGGRGGGSGGELQASVSSSTVCRVADPAAVTRGAGCRIGREIGRNYRDVTDPTKSIVKCGVTFPWSSDTFLRVTRAVRNNNVAKCSYTIEYVPQSRRQTNRVETRDWKSLHFNDRLTGQARAPVRLGSNTRIVFIGNTCAWATESRGYRF